jgi:hypothetical protein
MKTECNRPIEEREGQSNKIHRCLEEIDHDSGPMGQSDRLMVNQRIGRWRGRRR